MDPGHDTARSTAAKVCMEAIVSYANANMQSLVRGKADFGGGYLPALDASSCSPDFFLQLRENENDGS